MEPAQKNLIAGRSKIAGNAAALAVAGGAGMVFTLAQLGILSREMDPDLFGLFVVLRGFSLLLSTIVLIGLPQVLIRYLPSFQRRDERKNAIVMFAAFSAVILGLGGIMHSASPLWCRLIPAASQGMMTGPVVYWVSLASIALALKLLLYGAFTGQREMRLQMIFEVCYLALMTLLIFTARKDLGLVVLFRMIFFLNAAVFAAGFPAFLISVRGAPPGIRGGAPGDIVLPSFASYTAYSILLSLVALAFTDFDRFVMASVLPFQAISLFHVASRINGLIKRFLGFPVVALQPEVTRIYEEGRWDELAGKIVIFTKVTFIGAVYFSAVAAIAGRELILLVSGRSFIGAYTVFLVMLPGVPMAAFIAPLLSAMKGLHFMKWAVICDFVWMAVYFGTFSFLVRSWGIVGMAAAQLLASALQMTAAIIFSRRGGFFGGAGPRTGRVLAAFIAIAAAGTAVTIFLGLPAAVVLVLVSPLVLRAVLVGLRVFDEAETREIAAMIGIPAARKAICWIIGCGSVT